QLQAAIDAGWEIEGYVWCSPGNASNPNRITNRLSLFDGFKLEALWLDVEEVGLTREDVDADLAVCDAYLGGGRTGIYTAPWFFQNQGWTNVDWWADRPLWSAFYDEQADCDAGFTQYGGWIQCDTKQWSEKPLDQN